MDTRIGIVTGAMFAGALLAGALVADPGLFGPLSPGSIASAAGNVFHLGDREGGGHDENEDGGGAAFHQPGAQSAVDTSVPIQQATTGGRRDGERGRSRGPSSIFVNQGGEGPSNGRERDDD